MYPVWQLMLGLLSFVIVYTVSVFSVAWGDHPDTAPSSTQGTVLTELALTSSPVVTATLTPTAAAHRADGNVFHRSGGKHTHLYRHPGAAE